MAEWQSEMAGGLGPMVNNKGEVLRDAALADSGVVLLPTFTVEIARQNDERVTVLGGNPPPPFFLNAVYPQRRQRSELNRQLLAFLQARFAP